MTNPIQKQNIKSPFPSPFGTFVMEPVAFIFGFAFNIYSITVLSALYRKNCLQNYLDDVNVDCYDLGRTPEIEDIVQTSASYWNVVIFSVGMTSSIITLLIMGGFSDKYGRKVVLLMGLAGTMINNIGFLFVITVTDVSIYAVLPFSVIGMSLGGLMTFLTGVFAYQADIIPDKRILTQRLAGLQFATLLGSILAGLVVALSGLKPLNLIMITEIVYSVVFFYILAFTIQRSSMKLEICQEKVKTAKSISVPREAIVLLKRTVRTIVKPRLGRRRLYIWLMFYILMSHAMVNLGIHITFPLFVFRRPFEWNLTQLATYNTVFNCVQLLGTLFGALFLKKLNISEPAMVIICTISYTLNPLLIGVSTNNAMLILAAVLGSLSHLVVPTSKALIIACIGSDEIGQIFTGVALAVGLGVLLATVIFNIIYAVTESFFPGCVFLLQALISAIGLLGASFVHFDSKKDAELMKTLKMMSYEKTSSTSKSEKEVMDLKF